MPFGASPGFRDGIGAAIDYLALAWSAVAPAHQPTAEDSALAVEWLLGALESDSDIHAALRQIHSVHPQNNTFPGEAFVRLAALALAAGGVSPAWPIAEESSLGKFLPEVEFQGWENQKFRSALMAGAATHAGVKVDLLEESVWWRTDDFWRYAALAAVAWIRAVAADRDVPLLELCRRLRNSERTSSNGLASA